MLGCKSVSRESIEATIWLNNMPIPREICDREPDLQRRGFYRKLESGKYELVSFCKPQARDFVAMPSKDFNNILDKTLPKEKR